MTIKLILAGCGNMGYAMLSGWLSSGKIGPTEVVVIEPNAELRVRAEALRCVTASSLVDFPEDTVPELVVIAVKPQIIRAVVRPYSRFGGGLTTFVSLAAGTPISALEQELGKDAPIIRCMPNTPAAVGHGMMVLCPNNLASDEMQATVRDMFEANGRVATVSDEGLMDAVTAVSGSGPAYVFHLIEALTVAAEAADLPPPIAKLLAMQTVYGAATLAAASVEEPAALRAQVTSPNGTTAAGLAVLMEGSGMVKLVSNAVEAARLRSVELRNHF